MCECIGCKCLQTEAWVIGVHVFRVPATGAGKVSCISVSSLVKLEELVSRISAMGAMSVSEGKAPGGVSSQKDQGNCRRDHRAWESN